MIERLEEFAQLLRQNGLRVSPAESEDAVRALGLLPLEEKPLFRAALRATLVKRGADVALFDRLFELFWSGAKELIDGINQSLLARLELEQLGSENLEMLAQQLAQLQLSPLTQALLDGNQARLAQLLREATLALDFRGLQSPLQRSFYARRLLSAAGAPESEGELGQLVSSLRACGFDEAALRMVQRETGAQLKALEEAARRVAQREQEARDPPPAPRAGPASGASSPSPRRRSSACASWSSGSPRS